MPILAHAKKALRQSLRRAVVNTRVRSRIKTMKDKVTKEPTSTNLSQAFSALDKAIKKKIYHPNKVARLKSQLAAQVKKAATTKK